MIGTYFEKHLNISKKQYQSLGQLQVAALAVILKLFAMLLPIMLILTCIRWHFMGWSWVMYVHMLSFTLTFFVIAQQSRLAHITKIWLIVLSFTLVTVGAAVNMQDVFYLALYGSIATFLLVSLVNKQAAIWYQLFLFIATLTIGILEPNYTWVFIKASLNLVLSIAVIMFLGVIITALGNSLAMEQIIAKTERERIYRELHDGLGAHLNVALHLMQHNQIPTERVVSALKDSIDQIRMTTDSINIPCHDITSLLATMRHRLANKLKDTGITLTWQVEQLPELDYFKEDDFRHLQCIIYEVFSNVLQHAKANSMSISAFASDAAIHINFVDDGVGFDINEVKLNGIKQMQARASIIGADITIASNPITTEIHINLPLTRP